MGKAKSGAWLMANAVLLLLLFYGLVQVAGSGGRYFFVLELLGLLALLVLAVWGLVTYGKPSGKVLFFTVYLLYLANLVLVRYFKGKFYLVLLVLALLGFILSFPAPAVVKKKEKKEELHSMVFEEPPKAAVESKEKPATTYSPAKYVASKNSNVYHEPKCEWARKIDKSRQVWFDDKKEAIEKGYRKHDCVQ